MTQFQGGISIGLLTAVALTLAGCAAALNDIRYKVDQLLKNAWDKGGR
jgi:hypothetical protein